MNSRRFLTASAMVALLTPMVATVAFAAAPSNDTSAGATLVASLPASSSQGTTEATTDALDAQINQQCGYQVTNGSVWYTYTDTTGTGLVVDVTSSDFRAEAIILAGDPAAGGSIVACGAFDLTAAKGPAGTTYYVMAFSDTPGVTGGNLGISFAPAPPAPTAELTLDPRATAYKDGSMRLSGTYSCTNGDYYRDVVGEVTQTVGKTEVTAEFGASGDELQCDGAVHSWEAIAVSWNGQFSAGKAASVSFAVACGLLECSVDGVRQTIQVSRGR